jgi:hypothetical protein
MNKGNAEALNLFKVKKQFLLHAKVLTTINSVYFGILKLKNFGSKEGIEPHGMTRLCRNYNRFAVSV